MKKDWNSELYDKKHYYVFKYGEDLLELLDPKPEDRILDLGCGTGHLTKMISDSGAVVTGIDSSPEMINTAIQNYPSLNFLIMDATDFTFPDKFDKVFSNAVLHWIPEKEKVVKCISEALKIGGRFVAEFGGKDNIKNIVEALNSTFLSNGFKEKEENINWYFPSIGEYTSLLGKYGFGIEFASRFDRDTFLGEGVDILDWLEVFAKQFFDGIESKTKDNLLNEIKDYLSARNIKDGKWFIDYKRLRILAVKEI